MPSRATVVALMILLLPLVGLPLASFAQSPNPGSQLELGYGPSALRSVTDGIPVYTVGDQLWVMSTNSSVAVTLEAAPGSTAGVQPITATLDPGIPFPLHT